MVPLPPRIDAARALLPDVDTVPVLINTLLSCPVLVCPHAADMPYALGPAVVIVPLLVSVLPLPLAAMPSLKAPVVVIVAPAALVSVFPLVLPSIAAPRLVPLPAPPLSDNVPLLVMVLFCSTLRMGNGTAVLWEALTEAPGTTLIVTPVLPATATTGVLLLPEHVTVVFRSEVPCCCIAQRRAMQKPQAGAEGRSRLLRPSLLFPPSFPLIRGIGPSI